LLRDSLLSFFQDKYTKDTEWKYLIELTRDKIATLTTQQELQLLYTQIMKGKLNIIILTECEIDIYNKLIFFLNL